MASQEIEALTSALSRLPGLGPLLGGLGLHNGAGGGNTGFSGQVGFGEKHDVGAGDLILEHLAQGRVVLARSDLFRRQFALKPPCGHRLGIGQRQPGDLR